MSLPVSLSSPLAIAGVRVANRVFVAPMSGVSDQAFRSLAWRFGAGLVFSEMIASEALVEGKGLMALKALPSGGPVHAVQLAGREPKWLVLAAQMAEADGADLIDINMGCPAKRVTNGLCGSALMREPDLALRLIEAVAGSVKIPVTVKMRLGWDAQNLNAPDIARSAESAGVAMISIHGRTRCQFYNGSADWRAVSAVKQAVGIPVVVNGDIHDRASARQALNHSGADAVMIGRASYGAPWLAGVTAGTTAANRIDRQFVLETAIEHYLALLGLYGTQSGLRQARKHLGWYLARIEKPGETIQSREIMTSENPARIVALLTALFEHDPAMQAAAA